jgi:type II secretory ATPase GspE/PulE/Tfp pilus assembly ATPase PilB-like protein
MGEGCNRCRGTGFAGRIGIFELLIPNNELLEAIGRGATLQELRALTNHATLRVDGLEKVANGLTTPEEVLCVSGSIS